MTILSSCTQIMVMAIIYMKTVLNSQYVTLNVYQASYTLTKTNKPKI